MRIESSVTSISWIPSEAIKGMTKMPFEVGGVAHYDKPLPDNIDVNDLELRDEMRAFHEKMRGKREERKERREGRVGRDASPAH